ncbi:MAG: hypothetical protein APF77_01195 [Clostridia bacterium BRH_c25]|nr:MAG: hypothetical protein APF77_01195 [Clostridia bacterium BRH_c25]
MNEYEKYNCLRLDITLLDRTYTYEDMKELMTEPFHSNYPTKVGFEWYPAAVGSDFISIGLVFNVALAGIATTLLSLITTDLYNWAKTSLKKVLHNRNSFEESRVNINFIDTNITIYTFSEDEIIKIVSNIDNIIGYIKENNFNDKDYDFFYSEIVDKCKEFK